jgi:hypothetical protein
MSIITEQEFALAERLHSRTWRGEYRLAVTPTFSRTPIPAQQLLSQRAFPTWRTNKDGTKYIGRFEEPRTTAFAITFPTLAQRQSIFKDIDFDPAFDSFAAGAATKPVIIYHCQGCGVHVVKEGNHRLLYCAYHGVDALLDVYQVSSGDWSKATVDMKNFCSCGCFGPLQEAQ